VSSTTNGRVNVLIGRESNGSSKAWHLKYLDGAEVSTVARELQAEANAWHIEQGRSLARGDSYRWAGFAALMLAIILIIFCWLGWAK
jgi:hypothetical protein